MSYMPMPWGFSFTVCLEIAHGGDYSFSGGGPGGKEAAEGADDGGEDQAPDDGARADFKFEGDLAEGDEAADAGGEAVDGEGDEDADDAADEGEADGFEHEGSE